MKIASIALQPTAGAGLSALKLHRQFKMFGHNARLFVAANPSRLPDAETIPTRERRADTWWDLATVPIREPNGNLCASGLSGSCHDYLEGVHQWADVILLRWVTGTVSDFQISYWSSQPKPIVWTLSDMAPITGGCHYSRGCAKYHQDCERCPLTTPEFSHVPQRVLRRRSRLWHGITVVSPSTWLGECAKQSAIFRGGDVRVIRTGVELDVFKPTSQTKAQLEFGIPNGRKTVLFAAHSVTDPRKGADLLWKTITLLCQKGWSHETLQVILVGGNGDGGGVEGVRVISLGKIHCRDKMAEAYSAADVTVVPYREDNLPNVILESIACGTPVCGFGIGGISEVIKEGVNGRVATPWDVEELAISVNTLLREPPDSSTVRRWAVENLGISAQASRYIELFSELRDTRRIGN